MVHEYHGIGRYVGMEQMKVDGVVKDYVKIAYQGTDALYIVTLPRLPEANLRALTQTLSRYQGD